jgi:N-sulfoglucosamine sulfohydrolase
MTRGILWTVVLALGLGSAVSHQQVKASQTAQPSGRRPNILWISAEDISPDLGCYGDEYARTPNVDRLAAQGMLYKNAFATAPVCAPSRSAIITGMYPTTIGSMHMRSKAVPPPYVKAITEPLRAAGYYCTNNSKTDYNFEAPPANRPPASLWDETSGTAHWRNRSDPNQPFFAIFNLVVTHESQVRVPAEVYARNTARLTQEQRHDPTKAKLPPYYPDTPAVRKDWAVYYDNLSAMDHMVGDLLQQLEQDGLADKTIVFFWGDHGRGLPRGKRFVYDSGLRVPLIVRWPGTITPATSSDDLVCLFDLGPTALSLAGVPVPGHMQGQAFLGAQKKAPREYAFAHRDRMDEAQDTMRSARDKRYRYIWNDFPGRPYAQYIDYLEEMPIMKELRRLNKDHYNALSPLYGKALTPAQLLFLAPQKPAEELYDLTADPDEIHNLAVQPEHQQRLKKMREALQKWRKETGDLGLVPESKLRERMRPGGVWQKTAAPAVRETAAGSRVKITLSTTTEGASITYTTDGGEKARWLLYTGELTLERTAKIRAKACRLGYLDSDETSRTFETGGK